MDVDLPSGAKLKITVAPFPKALALNKALIRCAKGLPMQADFLQMDMGVLKDALVEAATSNEVEDILFQCLERTTYNGVRVTRDLFDDLKIGEAIRKDYYPMAWEVIRANCGPFFEQTSSWLKGLRPTPPATPPLK